MFGGFALLLWIGAALCFIAHAITVATHHEEAPDDNVCLSHQSFVFTHIAFFSYGWVLL